MSSERPEWTVEDGFGNVWAKCERAADCGLEVVRPGKVQCWCDDGSTEPPNPCPFIHDGTRWRHHSRSNGGYMCLHDAGHDGPHCHNPADMPPAAKAPR